METESSELQVLLRKLDTPINQYAFRKSGKVSLDQKWLGVQDTDNNLKIYYLFPPKSELNNCYLDGFVVTEIKEWFWFEIYEEKNNKKTYTTTLFTLTKKQIVSVYFFTEEIINIIGNNKTVKAVCNKMTTQLKYSGNQLYFNYTNNDTDDDDDTIYIHFFTINFDFIEKIFQNINSDQNSEEIQRIHNITLRMRKIRRALLISNKKILFILDPLPYFIVFEPYQNFMNISSCFSDFPLKSLQALNSQNEDNIIQKIKQSNLNFCYTSGWLFVLKRIGGDESYPIYRNKIDTRKEILVVEIWNIQECKKKFVIDIHWYLLEMEKIVNTSNPIGYDENFNYLKSNLMNFNKKFENYQFDGISISNDLLLLSIYDNYVITLIDLDHFFQTVSTSIRKWIPATNYRDGRILFYNQYKFQAPEAYQRTSVIHDGANIPYRLSSRKRQSILYNNLIHKPLKYHSELNICQYNVQGFRINDNSKFDNTHWFERLLKPSSSLNNISIIQKKQPWVAEVRKNYQINGFTSRNTKRQTTESAFLFSSFPFFLFFFLTFHFYFPLLPSPLPVFPVLSISSIISP